MTSFTESGSRWRQGRGTCRIVTEVAGVLRPVGQGCLWETPISPNNALSPDSTELPAFDLIPSSDLRVRASLVALTHDAGLVKSLRAVGAQDRDIFIVGSETDLARHLVDDSAGVVVLDVAATVTAIAQLTDSLKAQFPDVVLIVAGGVAEQTVLTEQVSNGAVYRFLHKPASEQRVRLFVDAAWRRRNSESTGVYATSTLAQLPEPASPRMGLGVLATAALGVAVAAGIIGWLMGHSGTGKSAAPTPSVTLPRAAPTAAAQAGTDTLLSGLLSRAAEAAARGDWILPSGNNAADLYRQALERHPGDVQAQAGLDKVVDQLLSAAEQDLLAQHLDDAEHLTGIAHEIAPNSVRAAFVATQLTRERDRAQRAQARQQLQQQQVDELDRKQKLVADARAALTAGNLEETATLIAAATNAGVDQESIDRLTRDLQGARQVAKIGETVADKAPAAAAATPPAAAVAAPPTSAATEAPTNAAVPSVPQARDAITASSLERVRYVAPEYPLSARQGNLSGWVDVAFDVQTDGSVADIAVLGAEPKNTFEKAAVAALRKWRYRPVERDGHPIAVPHVQMRIRFTLQ
jgi:protein TonB